MLLKVESVRNSPLYRKAPPSGVSPLPKCPDTPPSMASTLAYIGVYAKKWLSKVVRIVSVSCINPPFFGLLLYPHRGGLGRSFEHPLFAKWTSTLNIHLNIHPSKNTIFTRFSSICQTSLKPHLKTVMIPFPCRSNKGAYKAPVRPKLPCIKHFHTQHQKKATRVNVQPYVCKPFASLM